MCAQTGLVFVTCAAFLGPELVCTCFMGEECMIIQGPLLLLLLLVWQQQVQGSESKLAQRC